jgi:glycosyltransferase involved in cell wall biosynthesis
MRPVSDDDAGAPPAASSAPLPRLVVVITLAETGGAQTYLASLLPSLAMRFDVVVAAHGPGPLIAAAEAAGARFVPLRQVRRALNPLRDLLGLLELVRLFRRERPALVHLNSSKVGILGRVAAAVARVPVRVVTINGWAFSAHTGREAAFYRWVSRMVRPLATSIVCVSEAERELGLSARACTADQAVVIPNGVAVPPDPPPRPARELPVVISVTRLQPPKDTTTLIRALGHLEHDCLCRVVGDGPERASVETAVARNVGRAQVELLGLRDDVGDLLNEADLFVLASRSEGLPLSILEAMAAGLPVVASAVGGIRELVRDGETGWLVPPGDDRSLAQAIDEALADANLRKWRGAAGRRRVIDRFSVDACRASHLELFVSLLRVHRVRPS